MWLTFVETLVFQLELTPCKAEQPLPRMRLQEKKEEKDEKHTRKLFRKNLQIKGVFRLQAVYTADQRKAF